MQKTITGRKRNRKKHILEMIFFNLFNVLISVTTVFEGNFPNFNATPKANNVHHSSLKEIVRRKKCR